MSAELLFYGNQMTMYFKVLQFKKQVVNSFFFLNKSMLITGKTYMHCKNSQRKVFSLQGKRKGDYIFVICMSDFLQCTFTGLVIFL